MVSVIGGPAAGCRAEDWVEIGRRPTETESGSAELVTRPVRPGACDLSLVWERRRGDWVKIE